MAEPAKVLIVEDDPDEQALMERYITSFGYNVQTAPDGDVALERVKDWEPDLVLLDLHLPNVPGMIVLREIRENPALTDLPILVISGDESEETAIVCLSSGANEFIHKPVRMSELTVKVQNALELQDYKLRLKDLNRKLEREKSLLTRYFAKDLVEKLLNEEISADLGGTNLPATIMFVDMRDSTAIAHVNNHVCGHARLDRDRGTYGAGGLCRLFEHRSFKPDGDYFRLPRLRKQAHRRRRSGNVWLSGSNGR